MGHVGGGWGTMRPDFASPSADQALIGGDQRDIGIDPQPSIAREHLNVEMEVTGGAVGTVELVGNHPDFLAFLDVAATQDAVGIHD